MISPGQYKANGVSGSMQWGETDKGTLQVGINMKIKTPNGVEHMTAFFYFTESSRVHSYERLRALGWKGKGPMDIGNQDGIDANEVDIRITSPEQYRGADGSMKMGSSKIDILTSSSGTIVFAKSLTPEMFKMRLLALDGGGGPTPTGSGEPPPPF